MSELFFSSVDIIKKGEKRVDEERGEPQKNEKKLHQQSCDEGSADVYVNECY